MSKIEWCDDRHAKAAASRIGVSVTVYCERVEGGEKWCTACKRWHPRSAFNSDSSRGDRLAALCREQQNLRGRSRYSPKPRVRGRRFVGPRNDDRLQARRRVNYLVEIGLLPHPSTVACADCGHVGDGRRHEYDHHKGYAAEHHETVEAVCSRCHHRRERCRAKSNG